MEPLQHLPSLGIGLIVALFPIFLIAGRIDAFQTIISLVDAYALPLDPIQQSSCPTI